MSTYIIPVVIIFLIIFILMIIFNDEARIIRKLKNARLKTISSFNEGDEAKIIGTIKKADTPLISPLTNRECIGYHVLVEQEKKNDDTYSWKTIIDIKFIEDFIITDNEMDAIVRTNKLKSVIVKDNKQTSGFLNDATPQLEQFLNNHGTKSEGILGFNKTMRYREGILEPGELISVLGKGTWKMSKDLNIKTSAEKMLEISHLEDDFVYLSDDPSTTINVTSNR